VQHFVWILHQAAESKGFLHIHNSELQSSTVPAGQEEPLRRRGFQATVNSASPIATNESLVEKVGVNPARNEPLRTIGAFALLIKKPISAKRPTLESQTLNFEPGTLNPLRTIGAFALLIKKPISAKLPILESQTLNLEPGTLN
jgi:hypothetical protein